MIRINWFKKPPKIEFLCRMDSALVHYPIIEAKKATPEWFTKTTTQYAKTLANNKESADETLVRSIAKCNGIRTLLRTGWVVRTYQDIHLVVKANGEFVWKTPLNQKALIHDDFVGFHAEDSFKGCKALENKVPLVKIQTPWVAKIPEGYNLMVAPLAYADEKRFLTSTGIFDRGFGLMELNIIVLWQAGAGEFLIKAGTPIAHLMLVPVGKTDYVVRNISDLELRELRAAQEIKASMFSRNFSIIKDSIKQINRKVLK